MNKNRNHAKNPHTRKHAPSPYHGKTVAQRQAMAAGFNAMQEHLSLSTMLRLTQIARIKAIRNKKGAKK